MKIIECYIDGFGKLKSLKKSYTGGLNCILESNGAGKSTQCAFIKAMLYGLADSKRSSVADNDRKHYLPWGGGSFGGAMVIEVNGERYRIEREFGKRPSEDTFKLYDLSTGKESDKYSESIGEELLGIDRDGFEMTVFLSERAIKEPIADESIITKLSDVIGKDQDAGLIERAYGILAEQRRFYFKKGGGGELASVMEEIDKESALESETVNARNEEASESERRKVLEKSLGDAKSELDGCNAEIQAVLRITEDDGEGKMVRLRDELERARNERDGIKERLGDQAPTLDEIDRHELALREADIRDGIERKRRGECEELAELRGTFGSFDESDLTPVREVLLKVEEKKKRREASLEVLSERIPERREIEVLLDKGGNLKKSQGIPLAVLSLIALTLTVLSGVICYTGDARMQSVSVAVALLTLIPVTLRSVLIALKNRRIRKRAVELVRSVNGVCPDADAVTGDLHTILCALDMYNATGEGDENAILRDFVHKYSTRGGVYSLELAKELIERAERMIALEGHIRTTTLADDHEKSMNELRMSATAFIEKFRQKGFNDFGDLREAVVLLKGAEDRVQRIGSELASYPLMRSIGETRVTEAKSKLRELQARKDMLSSKVDELTRMAALSDQRCKELARIASEHDKRRARRDELWELHNSYSENLEILKLTERYLGEASASLATRYLDSAREAFERYTEEITHEGGEYRMDTSFRIFRVEGGKMRESEWYSRGYSDLYLFALRLSLLGALYSRETPILVLDDPFTALDDEKCKRAMAIIEEVAKTHQVIYFTCSESRAV